MALRRTTRLFAATAGAALGAAVVLATASAASAVVRYSATGKPGRAAMPPMYGWYGGYTLNHVLRFSARSVYRSPAARRRAQQICVQYKLYNFLPSYLGETPRWAHAWSSNWMCHLIYPGQWLNVGHSDFGPIPLKAYNAEVWVRWYVGARQIGSARYDYNLTDDYSCQTFKCYTAYGYGGHAYISFDY